MPTVTLKVSKQFRKCLQDVILLARSVIVARFLICEYFQEHSDVHVKNVPLYVLHSALLVPFISGQQIYIDCN
jgi:hypothetical protein